MTEKDKPYAGPKVTATSVAVSSGVGCKRCGCRMRAPLDDLCAPCREKKVGGAPNCYTRT